MGARNPAGGGTRHSEEIQHFGEAMLLLVIAPLQSLMRVVFPILPHAITGLRIEMPHRLAIGGAHVSASAGNRHLQPKLVRLPPKNLERTFCLPGRLEGA